jgi:hypothetical protein
MTQAAFHPERAQLLLAAWKAGFLSSSELVEWADRKIASVNDSSELPSWLLDLSLHGPEHCTRLSEEVFLPQTSLDFVTLFCCHVAKLDLADETKLERFANWIAKASLGEDLSRPEVMLGYQIDHLRNDCDRMDLAIDLLRAELPAFAATSRKVAATVLDLSH